MSIDDSGRLWAAYQTARTELLAQRGPEGYWQGQLASSALATATAVSALAIVERHQPTNEDGVFADESAEARLSELIVGGLRWLAERQNADGGWGDTELSLSNIATTMLVKAAFHLTGVPADRADLLVRADVYIARHGGIAGLRRRYGRDKTFAVPILTNCALAGFVPWKNVPSLPFELACLPQHWFRLLRLPVVSYAIPALVAIGQAKFHHRPPLNPLMRWVRKAAVEKSLRLMEQMQPASGGFLEATPLTSFVVMSLASIGRHAHVVTRRGVEFLLRSVRHDGSWPIDTNLATWNTTLAINALLAAANGQRPLPSDDWDEESAPGHQPVHRRRRSLLTTHHSPLTPSCVEWLLKCQHREVHPYTGAAPGGWAWTDLSGGVPDVDDTSGALLALAQHHRAGGTPAPEKIAQAASAGVNWLLEVQNADGGWPTFCRGWGKLPFDRSASDLTAHALRALKAWQSYVGSAGWEACSSVRLDAAVERGFLFLAKTQHADGSWDPLWFGNQYHPAEENPVYGTARVLLAYRDFGRLDTSEGQRGLDWLVVHQNLDGGWGGAGLGAQAAHELKQRGARATDDAGHAVWLAHASGVPQAEAATGINASIPSPPRLRLFNGSAAKNQEPRTKNRPETKDPLDAHPQSTVEETALAVEALLSATDHDRKANDRIQNAAAAGLNWLIEAVETKQFTRCSPIGFYFAKLWYFEKLYPLIFTVSALGQAARRLARQPQPQPAASLPVSLNANA
jgi:squalene-hopene/tetraprenyl-beta-curcumene cyclase